MDAPGQPRHVGHHGLLAFPMAPLFAGTKRGTQVMVVDPNATNPLGASRTNLTAGQIGR
jgi:hypothetical protein